MIVKSQMSQLGKYDKHGFTFVIFMQVSTDEFELNIKIRNNPSLKIGRLTIELKEGATTGDPKY